MAPGTYLTVSWNPVTTNQDGSAVTGLAGYRIYQRLASGIPNVYDRVVDVAIPPLNSGRYSGVMNTLTHGVSYTFAVTAYNVSNLESIPSAEVTATAFTSDVFAQGVRSMMQLRAGR